MSESAGRVVAWMLLDRGKPWYVALDEDVAKEKDSLYGPPEGLIALVPEQLLVDCETQRDCAVASRDWNLDQRKKLEAAVRALADEWGYTEGSIAATFAKQLRALTEKSEETK